MVLNGTNASRSHFGRQTFSEVFFTGLVLSIISLATIIANFLSLFALNMTKKYYLVYFITNLALTDFLLGLLVMPFTTVTAVKIEWIFGTSWCEIQAMLGFLLCQVSVTTIMLISVERYVMFTYPNKHLSIFRSGAEKMKFFVTVTWLYSGFWTFVAWQASRFSFASPELLNCTVDWRFNRTFTLVCGIITSCIPLTITVLCNFKVVRLIARWRVDRKVGSQIQAPVKTQTAEAKTTQMLIIVVVSFLICWFPYTVGGLCFLLPHCSWPHAFFKVSVVLCLFNSCVNPVIYGAFDRRFRRAVRHIFWHLLSFHKNTELKSSTPPESQVVGNLPPPQQQQQQESTTNS